MKNLRLFLAFALVGLFMGCGGGGGGGGGNTDTPVDIVLVDDYIIDATVSDGKNTPVRFQADKDVYHFYDTPKEFIKVSGGKFKSTNLDNKMSYNVPANTKIISPIVQFINQFPNTKQPLASALNVDEGALARDFLKEQNLNLAKLAQIIYAMNIHGLSSAFATNIKDVKNLSDIMLAATKSANGHSKKQAIDSFIYALQNKRDVLTLEQDVASEKGILQANVSNTPLPNNPNPQGTSSNSLKISKVTPEGNLGVKVDFSENVIVNLPSHKNAFTLRQIINSKLKLDKNETISVGANSVTLPLQNAIETENENNSYTVKIDQNFVSNEGVSLGIKSAKIDVAPSVLALQKVTYINNKTIKATFNLPLDSSTLSQSDFTVKGTISYEASNVSLDENDDKTVIITLGNTIANDIGYELVVKNERLSSKNGGIKLASMATKEFLSTTSTQTNPNEGFNLINAAVDDTQKKVILTFSKNIMQLPSKDMFHLEADILQEPLELNITDNNGTSNIVDIKPTSPLLSPENNNTSYELKIAKQTIFSTDGARTFGATYKNIFQVTTYPKVTNASLSGNSINVQFNIPVDLNASFVTVSQAGSQTQINLLGSATNYSITNANDTDFNTSSTTLTIKQGVMASDKKSVLDMDFVKDFNGSN